jgi:peptidoglycan-associated lipoprotein
MMKKFTYTAAIALAFAIASAGCAHKQPPVTNLPARTGDGTNPVIPSGPPVNPGDTNSFGEVQFPYGDWNQKPLDDNTIHFAFDSAVIRDSETANLQAVAGALNADKSANLMIQGNCDERGTEEYNRSLGERRAEAAREALVGMGIDVSRLHTISYGKDKPVDAGHDEPALSKNRRDDFVLLLPKTGA